MFVSFFRFAARVLAAGFLWGCGCFPFFAGVCFSGGVGAAARFKETEQTKKTKTTKENEKTKKTKQKTFGFYSREGV